MSNKLKIAMLNKFPHWNECLAPLKYINHEDYWIQFMRNRRVKEPYIDPLGISHETYLRSDFGKENSVVIVSGDVSQDTHPLSKGVIPYAYFKNQIAITHTSGYSPWDQLGMTDMVEISRSDAKNSQGIRMIYLMRREFYERFSLVDWKSTSSPDYAEKLDQINSLIEDGFIRLVDLEPSQYWLDRITTKFSRGEEPKITDKIGIGLNWANMNTAASLEYIISELEKVYEATGKRMVLKLHSYAGNRFKVLRECEFIDVYTYEELDKYEFMDMFDTYIVDPTGLGYEIAYRNPETDIYYLPDLKACGNEFRGVQEMGAIPTGTIYDLIDGKPSGYDRHLIAKTYPHDKDTMLDDYLREVVNAAEALDDLKFRYEKISE